MHAIARIARELYQNAYAALLGVAVAGAVLLTYQLFMAGLGLNLPTVMALAMVGGAGFVGWHVFRAKVAADVYRARLRKVAEDYETLRKNYNQAVRKSAVTELVVKGGKLSVVIRTIEGVLKEIPTSFDPKHEIHVDFVVVDGRLWVRRVHDSLTPARDALIVDPKLAQVEWDEQGKEYGLTVYRPLSEGRWAVSATSHGALALSRMAHNAPAMLVPPPAVHAFDELEKQIGEQIENVTAGDMVREVLAKARPAAQV